MKAENGGQSVYAQVVLDTNILISAALIATGVPAQLTDWLLQHARLVFSDETFAELETRLWKPKFDRYLSIERRHQLLGDLRASALWVDISETLATSKWSRDPDDDAFVRTALAADVQRLVTGDQDLLILQSLGTIRIVTAKAAVDELRLPFLVPS